MTPQRSISIALLLLAVTITAPVEADLSPAPVPIHRTKASYRASKPDAGQQASRNNDQRPPGTATTTARQTGATQ